ncbi:hypothetical protein [Halomonas sp.]|uniref:hypothetical protein n=1 Tax=Halomonas sp. TaxID=1486246 RepID=UPI003A8E4D3F
MRHPRMATAKPPGPCHPTLAPLRAAPAPGRRCGCADAYAALHLNSAIFGRGANRRVGNEGEVRASAAVFEPSMLEGVSE